MKTFTVEQFKTYLSKQDSFGDAVYFCTEENIEQANKPREYICWCPCSEFDINYEKGQLISGRDYDALDDDTKQYFETH